MIGSILIKGMLQNLSVILFELVNLHMFVYRIIAIGWTRISMLVKLVWKPAAHNTQINLKGWFEEPCSDA